MGFQKNTNDSRESPSIDIAIKLIESGGSLNIYDPMVKKSRIVDDLIAILKSRSISDDDLSPIFSKINIFNNFKDAIKKTNAIAILTEWDEFKEINFELIDEMTNTNPKVFDGRIILEESNYTIGK